MNLCFDLDGPLIDVTDRYYRAYIESLTGIESSKAKILDKEYFWLLKQNRITDFEIGIMSNLTISEAKKAEEIRRGLTFEKDYFSLDKLFDDVLNTFKWLKSNYITFFVVTLRRYNQLYQAINQFTLANYLNSDYFFSLSDKHRFSNDIQEKYLLLVDSINRLQLDPQDTWLIGDTETDIHAGKLAKYGGIIAISRGIRSKEQLQSLKPDYLINNLEELQELVIKSVKSE